MRRIAAVRAFVVAVLVAVLAALTGCSSDSAVYPRRPSTPFKHVVIIFQENRTVDNLFQDPVLIGRGADIVSSGKNSKGAVIPLTTVSLARRGPHPQEYDLDHSHSGFTAMCREEGGQCRMDGADLVSVLCLPSAKDCPPPNPPFVYVDPNDVQAYFQMAEQYAFADRMFQTNQGPSFPAHMFILSGTSAPSADSLSFVSDNPTSFFDAGCIAAPDASVLVIDQFGQTSSMYPCVDHPTLTDLLDSAQHTWRYYTPLEGFIWTAPTAIQHMCQPNAPPPNGTACVGPDYTDADPKVLISPRHFPAIVNDIRNHALPEVSWVIPAGQESDHPISSAGCGPAWVATIVNAIGSSEYWADTAIVITWDDWGGFYDHVAPKIMNSYEYGFRVPLIAISPYTRSQYVSHQQHDFGSILNLVEQTFHLPSLGYADAYADDLGDMFDYKQQPQKFTPITLPANTDACLNSTTPAEAPDTD